LLGRELQDLIRDEKLHWNLRLLSGDAEGAGALTADGEEATYLEPVTAEALRESAVIFLAGTRESGLLARQLHPKGSFIDLTGVIETGAKLAAPRIGVDPEGQILAIAHPASIALAFLLSKLDKVGEVERVVVTVFEPASERGHAGIGELQKQSAALLTFKTLPKEVYDAQLAYNVLPEFGEDAPLQLAVIEERIDRELRHLRGEGVVASVRLVQAPVFHGYSFLTWVRFGSPVADLESAFAGDPMVDLRSAGVEPPTNAGVTQQDGYQVGGIRRDRADSQAYWVWMTCDNLRTAASNALAAAKQIL
jgi:aspartate-semialdehyde dehydrogenase